MSKMLSLKKRLLKPVFGVVFAVLAFFGLLATPALSTPVYAEPAEVSAAEQADDTCYDQIGAIGWLVCPTTGVLGKAIDSIYTQIEKLLVVDPVVSDNTSPIYQVWQVLRDVTNVVFIVFLLIVVYSQVTGLGITNYGIKKALPKLIIAAVLVNLSYLICAVAVDASNIIGASLRGVFDNIQNTAINSGGLGNAAGVTWTQLAGALIGGGTIAGVAIGAMGGLGALIFPAIAALLCGILSVIVGLITIGLRQALVSILIMIAPLAMVAYLLPNTEGWFKKWKDIFVSMLIFYPMFSLLFGAAQLAGWALIASSVGKGSGFGIIVGMAVQVLPLILSISLMKMSGTVLGTVSSKLDNLMNKPKTGIRAAMEPHRQLAKNRYINDSMRPTARLQRALDKQQRTTELWNEKALQRRLGRAEVHAQMKAIGNTQFDPGDDKKGFKKSATAMVQDVKEASNTAMEVQVATERAQHVIGQYGTYYDNSARDKALNKRAATLAKEATSSSLALAHDNEADTDWLVDEYVKIANKGHDTAEYRHYIKGAAGALGEKGTESVLAAVIQKAAVNEARHRRDTATLTNKFKYNKSEARSMYTGYYVDDNGLAVDKEGRSLGERTPGEFLYTSPEKLVSYDVIDENGDPYYEARDQDGNFVSRIYKKDGPAMKELISNFDMPINDPINGLYGILAGHKEGEFANITGSDGSEVHLPYVGLGRYSTTIGRAMLSSHFKEKAAFAGPMYASAVMNRYIKSYGHQNISRLDNLNKTGKAGNFNTQDAFEISQLAMLMDPDNWSWIFPDEAVRTYRNVNGELLKETLPMLDAGGNIMHDENGNIIWDDNNKIDRNNESEGTIEGLRRTLFTKHILPAAPKFTSMMSRYTQGTADNQKPGTATPWRKLYDALTAWNSDDARKNYQGIKDPFAEQADNFVYTSKEIRERILPRGGKGNGKSAYSKDDPASSSTILDSHAKKGNGDEDQETGNNNRHQSGIRSYRGGENGVESHNYSLGDVMSQIEDLYNSNIGDPATFSQDVLDYLDSSPVLDGCAQDFSDYTFANPYATMDELYDEITDIVVARLSD